VQPCCSLHYLLLIDYHDCYWQPLQQLHYFDWQQLEQPKQLARQPRLGLSVVGYDKSRRGEGGRCAASSPRRRSRRKTRLIMRSFYTL